MTSAVAGQGENLEEASYNKLALIGCAPCASGAAHARWRCMATAGQAADARQHKGRVQGPAPRRGKRAEPRVSTWFQPWVTATQKCALKVVPGETYRRFDVCKTSSTSSRPPGHYSRVEKQSYFPKRRYADTPTRRHASPSKAGAFAYRSDKAQLDGSLNHRNMRLNSRAQVILGRCLRRYRSLAVVASEIDGLRDFWKFFQINFPGYPSLLSPTAFNRSPGIDRYVISGSG